MSAPAQPTPLVNRQVEDRWAAKLWLWKNGDHYLAFDSDVPTYDGGDPKTLGEPIGYALLEWETYDRMTEQVAAQRAAEAVMPRERAPDVPCPVTGNDRCSFGYCRETPGCYLRDGNIRAAKPAATPPPGDAGERARDDACTNRIGELYVDGTIPEWAAEQIDELHRAALQSERTAAASQARRETLSDAESVIRAESSNWSVNDLPLKVVDALVLRIRALATPQE